MLLNIAKAVSIAITCFFVVAAAVDMTAAAERQERFFQIKNQVNVQKATVVQEWLMSLPGIKGLSEL